MKPMMRLIFITCACAMLQSAWCQNSNQVEPSRSLADSLFLRRDYKAAIEVFNSILSRKPDALDAVAWSQLGQSYHALNDYDRALQSYDKAYQINRRTRFLFLNMAKVTSVMGQVDRSIALLDSAVLQGFGNFKMVETHADFANLRKSNRFMEIRDRIYNNAYPCLNLPAARAFDFWLGEWDVYLTSDSTVKTGINKITLASGGCVILESWESVGAHTGVSINYFDPANGKWQQKWAGAGQDIIEFYDGEYLDGAMRFKWDGTNNGQAFFGRLTFTNLKSGKVRQHSERSLDNGKTWQTVYDFMYMKQEQ